MKSREIILVVDDSSVIRKRMKAILTGNGYEVILRDNGEAGVLAALEYAPDLIIMDLNMPGMDGFTASVMLKKYSQTRMIPIAVFTDENETRRKVEFFEVGVEDFIIKNADEAEVIARVSGLLRWKRNREELLSEKSRLGNLVDSLSDLVITFDTNDKIVFYNRVAAARFTLIPELIQEMTIYDVLPDSEAGRSLTENIRSREEIQGFEMDVEHHKGKVRSYEVDINRVYVELSDDVGGAFVLRDVTAEKEAEKLKAEFYSMMAHEMRTPISVVLGYTQLILDRRAGEISELQEEFLRGVEDKGKALLTLVDDFLEVSRLEGKFVKLDRSEFDFRQMVEKSVSGIRLLADNKSIKLDTSFDGSPTQIVADRDKLEHVMTNLVENAIKYTEEGGSVSVRCNCSNGSVKVEVEDTGIGMSEEEITCIFDRFKRLGKAEKKKIKGTGLGLAIVKEIVDAHDGTIRVESRDGVGSLFHLWIPSYSGDESVSGVAERDQSDMLPVPE
ncbi:MAG: response regulator [Bacteroidales bacterium]|nr:response regulator [Candidatus Latescibacterota bacterium]